ncbi:unannotated protein [freshwater metagenome]|uniref:Unannotated protein n=1 Tax=freshwater metagenome TaxID=449393 RepID=A0A6J6JC76_9ZZZZ|nr:hypothetical protein [Actinomycetota bacterium]
MKIIAWLVIFALAAQFFQAAPWLLFVFGGLVALGIYLSRAKRAALEADTLKAVGDEPLGNILDPARAMTAQASRQLLGDDSFSFEVVGESFYAQNFSALQKNAGLVDGQDWDDTAFLVVDPGNYHSKTAVAVFVSGLKLGHVAEENAPGVFRFLLQSGGYAKADAAIFFSAADGQNSIWLDAVIPVLFKN